MEIRPCGTLASRRMPGDWFTGTVWQDPIIESPEPARLRAAWVRFEPGARTAWHTHPLGQTLVIMSGIARVQTVGGSMREVRAGDVIWFARAKSTGTARRLTSRWSISPCRKRSMAGTSIGWSMSRTLNTAQRRSVDRRQRGAPGR